MKSFLVFLALMMGAADARAANGWFCEYNDYEYGYKARARHRDDVLARARQGCLENSPQRQRCFLRGCRPVKIEAWRAKAADAARAEYLRARRLAARSGAGNGKVSPEVAEKIGRGLDRIKRDNAIAEQNRQLERIARELERRRFR